MCRLLDKKKRQEKTHERQRARRKKLVYIEKVIFSESD